MELQSLQKSTQTSHLKVIKNTRKLEKNTIPKIYINTLIPNFSYTNSSGETITSGKSILL